jgi:hypothetical protein
MLDAHRLRALYQRRSAAETVPGEFERRRLALTRAALLRAEAGKPATGRTVRRLAAFNGVDVAALIDARPRAAVAAADACGSDPGMERLLCRALVDAVRAARCGHLVEVRGAHGAARTQLLDSCVADARAAGYAPAVLGTRTRTGQARHCAGALMLALLGLEDASVVPAARLAEYVRARCRMLGLAPAHIDACVSLLEGTRRWPLPAVHLLQTAALCALIQLCARTQPLLVAIDGLHDADWQLTIMLGVLVPATRAFPVLWVLAADGRPAPSLHARTTRLDTLARTVLQLAPQTLVPDGANAGADADAGADAASVHRIARTAPAPVAGPGRLAAQARSMASTRSG